MRRQGRHRYPGRSGRHTGRVCGDNHQRRLVDQGKVDLAAPVQTYLPGFAGKGKDRVTVAMLLAHTGGLPVGAKGTGLPNDAARREAVLTTPLVRSDARRRLPLLQHRPDGARATGGETDRQNPRSKIDGGTYNGPRILSAAMVKQMLTNANKGKRAYDAERPGRPSDHGLGVALNQPWFMGRLSGPATFGHTGFTGTSMLVEPRRKLVLVLLTNRAHPNWSWADSDPVRVAVANAVAAKL